jgi:hypothetical protein
MDTTTARIEEHRSHGEQLVARVRALIREGNVRRISIRNDEGRTLIEIPLTIGVVGALFAPAWAALGAVAALVSDCSIEVDREEPAPRPGAASPGSVDHASRADALLDAHEDELHVDREC